MLAGISSSEHKDIANTKSRAINWNMGTIAKADYKADSVMYN